MHFPSIAVGLRNLEKQISDARWCFLLCSMRTSHIVFILFCVYVLSTVNIRAHRRLMADPCPQAQPACSQHLWPSSCTCAAKPKCWSGSVVRLVPCCARLESPPSQPAALLHSCWGTALRSPFREAGPSVVCWASHVAGMSVRRIPLTPAIWTPPELGTRRCSTYTHDRRKSRVPWVSPHQCPCTCLHALPPTMALLSEEQAPGSAWPGDVGRDREEASVGASVGAGTPYTALWHKEWSPFLHLPQPGHIAALGHACPKLSLLSPMLTVWAGAVTILCLIPW